MATRNTLEELITEHDVARVVGLSVASVRRWRLLRQGPKYLKIGAAVRYKPKSVMAWLNSRDIRRQTLLQDRLCACLRRFAVLAGVEALRAVLYNVLGKLR